MVAKPPDEKGNEPKKSSDTVIKAKTAKLNIKGQRATVNGTKSQKKEAKPSNQKKEAKTVHFKADNLTTGKPTLSEPELKESSSGKETGSVEMGERINVVKSTKEEKEVEGFSKGSSSAKGVGSGETPSPKGKERKGKFQRNYFVIAQYGNRLNLNIINKELEFANQKFQKIEILDGDFIYIFRPFKGKPGLLGRVRIKIAKETPKRVRSFITAESTTPIIDSYFEKVIFKNQVHDFSSKEKIFPIIFQISQNDARNVDAYLSGNKQTPDNTLKPKFTRAVKTQSDTPSAVDQLERKDLAAAFSKRLKNMWVRNSNSQTQDPLIIHLNAPWGAGKTSFFYLIRKDLKQMKPAWVVIDFNAWQHQHIKPPWWSLLQETYRQATAQLTPPSPTLAYKIEIKENFRRFLAGRHSLILGAFLFALFMFFGTGDIKFWNGLATALGGAATIGALFHETLLGSSAKSAEAYAKLTKDPQIRLKEHFGKLIKDIEKPVLVFIDDIDRCKPEYVVDLLEGIMTIFRSNRCFFLIAGDSAWIQKCFEKVYDDFRETSNNPGKKLGHHFLEKVFQFSISLPPMSSIIRKRYWALLLEQSLTKKPAAKGFGRREELDIQFNLEEYDKLLKGQREALAAFSDEKVDKNIEHFLTNFSLLIEANPRMMKRLVNTYAALAMSQVTFEGDKLSLKMECKLALWAIFTHRWPVLVDYLRVKPHKIEVLIKTIKKTRNAGDLEDKDISALIKDDLDIAKVVTGKVNIQGIKTSLEAEDFRHFLGLPPH